MNTTTFFLHESICRWGTYNEYHNICFHEEIRKISVPELICWTKQKKTKKLTISEAIMLLKCTCWMVNNKDCSDCFFRSSIFTLILTPLTTYHILPKIWTIPFYYFLLCLKTAGWMANNVDPDLMGDYTVCSDSFVRKLRVNMLVWSRSTLFAEASILEVVGCGEGVMYLMLQGRPTDIGLQLARPAILVAGKGRGRMFLFLLFHSCSSFFPVPHFHLLHYLF